MPLLPETVLEPWIKAASSALKEPCVAVACVVVVSNAFIVISSTLFTLIVEVAERVIVFGLTSVNVRVIS